MVVIKIYICSVPACGYILQDCCLDSAYTLLDRCQLSVPHMYGLGIGSQDAVENDLDNLNLK